MANLPSEQQLRENFPHADNCQANRSKDVVQRVTDADLTIFDFPVAYVSNLLPVEKVTQENVYCAGLIQVKHHYLKCQQCDCQAEYDKYAEQREKEAEEREKAAAEFDELLKSLGYDF